jgi:hypothetical protein
MKNKFSINRLAPAFASVLLAVAFFGQRTKTNKK